MAEEQESVELTKIPVPLTIGYFSAPQRSLPWLEKEIEDFQVANPQIALRAVALRHPTRMELGLDEIDILPNVFCIDSESGAELASLVEHDLIIPLDELAERDGLSFDSFPLRTIEAIRIRDQTWGIPWLSWTLALVYRPSALEEVGLSGPPTTWSEFDSYCEKLSHPPDGENYRQYGSCLNTTDETIPFLFLSMLLQQGGQVMEGGQIALDKPAALKALQTLGSIMRSENVEVTDKNPAEVILNNFPRAAMYIINTRYLPYLQEKEGLALALLPSFADAQGQRLPITASYRSLYFSVRRSSTRQEEAAWEFVKWMTREDQSLPPKWEGYPTRMDFPKRRDFLNATLNGPDNYSITYTAMAEAADPGGIAPGRLLGLAEMWKHLEPLLKDMSQAELVIERAEASGNQVLNQIRLKQ